MKSNNPKLVCIVYRGQQADGTFGTQMPMHGGPSYLLLDDILPPPAEDMINDIGDEPDDDTERRHPDPGSFPMTKTGFQQFKMNLQRRIITQQQYLEVIRNCAPGLFANYEQSVVADEDVAWLRKHDHIVNPPAVGLLANRKRTRSCPAIN